MSSKLEKRTYYVVTVDGFPDWSVENYGDRNFYVKDVRRHPAFTVINGVGINGDTNWDISEAHIEAIGAALIEENANEYEKQKAEQKAKPIRSWLRNFLGA